MKNLLFAIAAIALLASCSGKNNSENRTDESLTSFDSVSSASDSLTSQTSQPEAKDNMAHDVVEKNNQETLDSDDKAFQAAIPNPKKLYAG